MKGCKAIQQSDQMYCDACGLVWDMNDPDPPECGKDGLRTAATFRGVGFSYEVGAEPSITPEDIGNECKCQCDCMREILEILRAKE